jgi:chromosome segregation ATPase
MAILITFCVLSIVISTSSLFFLSKKLALTTTVSNSQEFEITEKATTEVCAKLAGFLQKKPEEFGSKQQLESVSAQLIEVHESIENERTELKNIENSLLASQNEVEERETKIHEIKGARQQEIKALEEVKQNFEKLSEQSTVLESNLQNSLVEIERLGSELELTQDQKDTLNEFSEIFQVALNDLTLLMAQADDSEERVKNLAQQYRNLEDEYTALVEKQFA